MGNKTYDFSSKKKDFLPKTTKNGPKLAFLTIAGSFGALFVGWLVVVARAVSRKTPIYFIYLFIYLFFLGGGRLKLIRRFVCALFLKTL